MFNLQARHRQGGAALLGRQATDREVIFKPDPRFSQEFLALVAGVTLSLESNCKYDFSLWHLFKYCWRCWKQWWRISIALPALLCRCHPPTPVFQATPLPPLFQDPSTPSLPPRLPSTPPSIRTRTPRQAMRCPHSQNPPPTVVPITPSRRFIINAPLPLLVCSYPDYEYIYLDLKYL